MPNTKGGNPFALVGREELVASSVAAGRVTTVAAEAVTAGGTDLPSVGTVLPNTKGGRGELLKTNICECDDRRGAHLLTTINEHLRESPPLEDKGATD